MIVLEGVDNSGKSTLARRLQVLTKWPIIASEGPPKYSGEQNDRVKGYFQRYPRDVIFDRHPCVSQNIYAGTLRGSKDLIDSTLVEQFYSARPLFIYCDPLERGLGGHVIKNNSIDKPEHLDQIAKSYARLLEVYRAWALTNALFYYRIGDPVERIVHAVAGILDKSGE